MADYIDPGLTSRQQIRAGQMGRRLPQLLIGLFLFGWSMAMMVESDLGLMPWDVFHQGVAQHVSLTFGQVVIVTGALVLLLWIPLRQWPGLGTILNVFLIGLAADLGLKVMSQPEALWAQIFLVVGGIVVNGIASALYIGVHLGTGPRDGLSMALNRITGRSVRLMRTGVEIIALVIGVILGGTIGIGTILYAVGVGPLLQLFLPLVQVNLPKAETTRGEL